MPGGRSLRPVKNKGRGNNIVDQNFPPIFTSPYFQSASLTKNSAPIFHWAIYTFNKTPLLNLHFSLFPLFFTFPLFFQSAPLTKTSLYFHFPLIFHWANYTLNKVLLVHTSTYSVLSFTVQSSTSCCDRTSGCRRWRESGAVYISDDSNRWLSTVDRG